MNRNELYHHGIKGMRWGVRRYQNADGSLTPAGESRYKRGKRYAVEERKVARDEERRLREKVYKADFDRYTNEVKFLAKKYGLDEDDAGGGDTDNYTEIQLQIARQRVLDLEGQMLELNDKIAAESRKAGMKYVKDKYGDMAVNDLMHYENVNSLISAAALIAAFSGIVVGSAYINGKKKAGH